MSPEDCNHIDCPWLSSACSQCGTPSAKHVSDMSRDELTQHLLRYKSIIPAVDAFFKDLWKRHPEIAENKYKYTCSFMQELHDVMVQSQLLFDSAPHE